MILLIVFSFSFASRGPHPPALPAAAMGRLMQDYRIPSLWRHSPAVGRTVLLKTNSLPGPRFNPEALVEILEFFYKAAALQGQHGHCEDWVYAGGNPIGGKVSGIGALPSQPGIALL